MIPVERKLSRSFLCCLLLLSFVCSAFSFLQRRAVLFSKAQQHREQRSAVLHEAARLVYDTTGTRVVETSYHDCERFNDNEKGQTFENIRWIENRLASKNCGYSWADIKDVVRTIHFAAAACNPKDSDQLIDSLNQITSIVKLLLETCESPTESGRPSVIHSKDILLACIWHYSESVEAGQRGLLQEDFILSNVLLRCEDYQVTSILRQNSNIISSLESENSEAGVIPVIGSFELSLNSKPFVKGLESLNDNAWTIARCAARMKRIELLSRLIDSPSLSRRDADYIRCLFLTVEGFDWRSLLVRCVINLFATKSATTRSRENIRTAREGLLIYGPLASMLGLHELKLQIEDNAFRFLYPRQHRVAGMVIGDDIEQIKSFLHNHVQHLLNKDQLLREQVEDIEVTSRVKERYSLWRKLLQKNRMLSTSPREIGTSSHLVPWDSTLIYHVPDAIALRVVIRGRSTTSESDASVQAKEELLCYYVQEKLKTKWAVWDPKRSKDYIQSPKSNNYRSLHYTASTQVGEEILPFEVQVRSHEMHLTAEYGPASHSLYKFPTTRLPKIGGAEAVQGKSLRKASGYLDFVRQIRKALSNQDTIVFVTNIRDRSNKIVSLPNDCRVADVISILCGVTNATLYINGKRSTLDDSIENGDVLLLFNANDEQSTLVT